MNNNTPIDLNGMPAELCKGRCDVLLLLHTHTHIAVMKNATVIPDKIPLT